MRPLLLVLLLAAASGPAGALDVTTRLLTAAPGSWTRRYAPHSFFYTHHVVSVDNDVVELQLLKHHHRHLRENHLVRIATDYIREAGIDPDSPGARVATIEHEGKTQRATVVRAPIEDSNGDFYFTDSMPATGIIRIDILDQENDPKYTLWIESSGLTPDELIRTAGPPVPANHLYGIPEPPAKEGEDRRGD